MPRSNLVPAFLVLALLAAAPLAAQTILVSVQETASGAELPAPLPASDGLQSSLFDKGFIVFETPASAPRATAKELAGAAQSLGAEAALLVQVEYKDAAGGGDMSKISASASFTLVDAETGGQRMKGVEQANNRAREKPLTRAELGKEIGARVAARIIAALAAGKTSP